MPRYRILIEYDGTPFVGWQVQANGASVQGRIAEALQAFCGETVMPQGAGRTDTGVHALGQVAHFELQRDWPSLKVREALNYHLKPSPIAILDCAVATADFDARFSATRRHYLYRLLCRRARPALDRNRVWWVTKALDADAMDAAAQVLVGHHDFTTFRASACQAASPVKTLDALRVSRVGHEIHVRASARSFLHNQVRSMVGCLKEIGTGKWQGDQLALALAAKNRAACAAIAPPDGLYLTQVDYDGADVAWDVAARSGAWASDQA